MNAPHTKPLAEAEEMRRGKLLAEVLQIKRIKTSPGQVGCFQTTWGTKSALGLFRTVERIILDGE